MCRNFYSRALYRDTSFWFSLPLLSSSRTDVPLCIPTSCCLVELEINWKFHLWWFFKMVQLLLFFRPWLLRNRQIVPQLASRFSDFLSTFKLFLGQSRRKLIFTKTVWSLCKFSMKLSLSTKKTLRGWILLGTYLCHMTAKDDVTSIWLVCDDVSDCLTKRAKSLQRNGAKKKNSASGFLFLISFLCFVLYFFAFLVLLDSLFCFESVNEGLRA